MAYTPSKTFARWYMTRLTCGPLLLKACRLDCVPANILDHLQIPQFRVVMQIRLSVPCAGQAPTLQALSRHEIPLALRQLRDIAPLGIEDADVAFSLHFYFLTARIPLAIAQVQHLSSPERLVFGSAPLLRVAKRPRHAASFPNRALAGAATSSSSLMWTPWSLLPPSAASDKQPGKRTQAPRSYKQQGLGPKYSDFSVFGFLVVFGCLLINSQGSGPKHPKRQLPLSPSYLALRATVSALRVPWSADDPCRHAWRSLQLPASDACDA